MIDLLYSNTFMAAQGPDALDILERVPRRRFTLVVEGAIPTRDQGLYNIIARTVKRNITALEAVTRLGNLAEYVVAIGTCASFGGPTAARPNITGSVGVRDVLDREIINVSGCPVNPALLKDISEFVKRFMIPDTELIARVYSDYYSIGLTPRRLLSFGLFKFGAKNETLLWISGVLVDNQLTIPHVDLIEEDVTRAWFRELNDDGTINHTIEPDPYKQEAYTWVKSVRYAGQHFQGGPLARMIITGRYRGCTSTMDRIYARSLETLLITELVQEWLYQHARTPKITNIHPSGSYDIY